MGHPWTKGTSGGWCQHIGPVPLHLFSRPLKYATFLLLLGTQILVGMHDELKPQGCRMATKH